MRGSSGIPWSIPSGQLRALSDLPQQTVSGGGAVPASRISFLWFSSRQRHRAAADGQQGPPLVLASPHIVQAAWLARAHLRQAPQWRARIHAARDARISADILQGSSHS
ncbi:hypothetical protein D3C75_690490 [compost metagenome]